MQTVKVILPRLHQHQTTVKREARRFNAVDCGRRWGKSFLGADLVVQPLLSGYPVGWFAPTYKLLNEAWRDIKRPLVDVIARSSEQEKRLELVTGGVLEFWTLEDEDAGRSRKYKRVIIDEAAMAKKLQSIWQQSIRPTLTDFQGDAWMFSTPKGLNYFHTCYEMGQDTGELEWMSWCMPTALNPFIAPAEIEAARHGLPDRVFRQEYLAEFIDDGAGVFLGVDRVVGDRVANEPKRVDRDYFMGVDLARYEDFTVIDVCDNTGRQVFHERFNLISWERQIDRLTRVATLYAPNLWIVIDATGVGDPVYERLCAALRDAGVTAKVEPYKFTVQTKEACINNLAIGIEHQEMDLMNVPVQTSELKAFTYEVTPGGNIRMNAPDGMHDDCVTARALSEWGRTQLGNRPKLRAVSLYQADEPPVGAGNPAFWSGDEGWSDI